MLCSPLILVRAVSMVDMDNMVRGDTLVGPELLYCLVRTAGPVVDKDSGDVGADQSHDVVEQEAVLHCPAEVQAGPGQLQGARL